MHSWRLILDDPAEGAWNMALDRALLDAYDAGEVPPTLRLYSWNRPTVSLGRFQPLEDLDLAVCASRGIAACRRPTGGRGVLHDDEVTYSIVAGTRDGLPRGTSASYRMLCAGLVEAYREIGIDADLTARNRGEQGAGACYLHATPADLSLGAAKLSGSAQVWHRESCLQHGSFVISRDVDMEADVFRLGARGKRALVSTTETIANALGYRPEPEWVRQAVTAGVARGLDVRLELGRPTDAELRRARELVDTYLLDQPPT